MESQGKPKSRLTEELESLRKQIFELQKLVIEPALAEELPKPSPAPEQPPAAPSDPASVVQKRLGFLPPFLLPGLHIPLLLKSLSEQMLGAYLDNPIPDLAKERLFGRLARRCPVSYATVSHSCILKHLGMSGGDIKEWLERPLPAPEPELARASALFSETAKPLGEWPAFGTDLENAVLSASMSAFLDIEGADRFRDELRDVLGPYLYASLLRFLGYVRSHFLWLQAYPELPYESDGYIRAHLTALLSEEPHLSTVWRSPEPVEQTGGAHPAAVDPGSALLAFLEILPVGAALVDSEFRIVETNAPLRALMGDSIPAATSLFEIVNGIDIELWMRSVQMALTGTPTPAVDGRIRRREGDERWIQFTAAPLGRTVGGNRCLALFEDITSRTREREQLQERTKFTETLIRNSHDGVFAFDRDGRLAAWNPIMEELFGLTEAEALGQHTTVLLPYLKEGGSDQPVRQALGGATTTVRRIHRVGLAGPEIFLELRLGPVCNEIGEVIGGIGVARDMSEVKRAVDAQKATEERYQELFESAHDMMYTQDLEGNLTSMNKAGERITGYARPDALRLKLTDLVAPECLDVARRMVERQAAGETPPTYELEILARDSHRVALEISSRPIFREGRMVSIQGIARDVTERKRTEEELQLANQKLEAWVSELQQRTREMTLLSEMGDMLRACFTTEEAYTVIVRVAQQVFPVQVGALYVITSSRNLVEAVAIWGDASAAERVFAPDDCWALRRGRVHWVENSKMGLVCKHLRHPAPRGYLCVPMMAQSEALGVLHLAEPDDSSITDAKQRLAVTMAEHIAMALSNLRLHETLRSQSIRDPLTGLFNRHFMEESLELELRRAARNQRPLGIIMLELDNFKELSVGAGRDAADAAIRETGNLIQSVVRKEDVACRFGGEKFVVLLPQGGAEVTQQRAENFREMIKRLEIKHRSQSIGKLTASLGIAVFPDNGRTVEVLLRVTEGALNRARADGGDRIVVAR
jgi:diguanylate cyclase (GGDEF)-like protein/PAS domain S-box-containing protein